MSKYTNKLTKPTDILALQQQNAANTLIAKQRLQSFRNDGILGTTNIDKRGQSMAEIAARFIDSAVYAIEDPAFDMIQFQIDWLMPSGLFADESETDSALRYLKETGELDRYNALLDVIVLLKSMFDANTITATASYRLKSVEGLSEANDNYRKIGVYSHIALQCYDDIKWTIRAINQKLEFIFYDNVRQTEVLPMNLRMFHWYMTIMDCRDLRIAITEDSEISQIDNMFVDKQGRMQSMFISCPIAMFDVIHQLPDAVSNIEQNELQGSFKLLCGPMQIHLIAPALFYRLNEAQHIAVPNSSKVKLSQQVLSNVKSYAASIIAGYVKTSVNLAQSYAMTMMANKIDELNVDEMVNATISYAKPSLLMQSFASNLDKSITAKSAYSDSLGKLDTNETNASQYRQSLGKID